MINIIKMQRDDCRQIAAWNLNKGQDFLYQWAGRKIYSHPLDADQLTARLEDPSIIIFKITNEEKMIGTVELNMDDCPDGTAKVCRFLIPEPYSGKGIGQEVLQRAARFASDELDLSRLELGVYTFNVRAIRCYEKSGFIVKAFHKDPRDQKWNSYTMEKFLRENRHGI
ncbi:MAG: GNAT family N-acetyltransferase [Spirochaetia bacterium]